MDGYFPLFHCSPSTEPPAKVILDVEDVVEVDLQWEGKDFSPQIPKLSAHFFKQVVLFANFSLELKWLSLCFPYSLQNPPS